jgi:NTE family protein
MKKTGIVLSGGGARSFGHLGLLAVFDELGIRPYAISAVSGGALIGALYASGIPAKKILEIAKDESFFKISDFLWKQNTLFSLDPIEKLLKQYIPENSFEALQIKFFVNVTDFTHNKTVFYSEGELWKCLLASASVPVIFKPVVSNESLLVDGGLLNNLPVEPLEGLCDIIIGSHVNKLDGIKDGRSRLSRIAILERCFHMAIATTVYSRGRVCDLLLEPPLMNFGMFDTRNAENIFNISYEYALKGRETIKGLAG